MEVAWEDILLSSQALLARDVLVKRVHSTLSVVFEEIKKEF